MAEHPIQNLMNVTMDKMCIRGRHYSTAVLFLQVGLGGIIVNFL